MSRTNPLPSLADDDGALASAPPPAEESAPGDAPALEGVPETAAPDLSVPPLAQAAEATQEAVVPSSPKVVDGPLQGLRVVLVGYFGFDNLGDELILRVYTEQLLAWGCEVVVLSQTPKETAARYGVTAIHRMSPLDWIDALAQADALIYAGGGLFQDASGPLTPMYYGGMGAMAHFFEVPILFWNQGIGPIKRSSSRWILKKTLGASEAINVRDADSAAWVRHYTQTPPIVTPDPVWCLDPHAWPEAFTPERPDAWRIGLSLRPHPDLTEARMQSLAHVFRDLIQSQGEAARPVSFWLMPCQSAADQPVLERFVKALGDVAHFERVPPQAVPSAITQCHVLFGMRLHSLLLGIRAEIPVFGLVYDPKVRHLLDSLGLAGVDLSNLDQLNVDLVQQVFAQYTLPDVSAQVAGAMAGFDGLRAELEKILVA